MLNRGDDVKWVFCCHRGKCGGLCGRYYDCIMHRDVKVTLSENRDLFMLAGFQLLEQIAYLCRLHRQWQTMQCINLDPVQACYWVRAQEAMAIWRHRPSFVFSRCWKSNPVEAHWSPHAIWIGIQILQKKWIRSSWWMLLYVYNFDYAHLQMCDWFAWQDDGESPSCDADLQNRLEVLHPG